MWIEDNVDAEYVPRTAYWYDDIETITKKGQNEITIFFDLCKTFFEDYKNRVFFLERIRSKYETNYKFWL